MVDKFNYVHLSAGDLLRAERKRETPKASLIESYLVEGKIVPSEITVSLLEDAMMAHGWDKSSFIIDGFPRNFENMN
jgi:adenylate kinase family enzyme